MIGAWLRRKAFWMLDAVRGGAKKKHYRDIQNGYTQPKDAELRNILEYASAHVPFYKALGVVQLEDFPVMKKTDYRNEQETAFYSDEFAGQSLHAVYTSGSTGNPFKVVQDAEKRNRTICDLIACHDSIGWKLGDRYVFIRNWVSNYKQSRLKSFMQNSHNVNITGFDDQQKQQLTNWLKKHKNVVILGYASALNEYAVFLQNQNIDAKQLHTKLLVSDSDALTPSIRNRLISVFGCPVFNRYDNEENGLLGISNAHEDAIRLNTASLYFEILKLDTNEPAEPGEIGRVVVTDLYNKAMPLIRYDTGDLAATNDAAGCIHVLTALYGRTAGSLTNMDGRLVSDVAISGAMEPFVGIVKYQIIQKNHGVYEVSYVGQLTLEERNDISARMHACFGEMADVRISCVDDIPCEKTGKYKTTKNETTAP